MPLYVTLCHFMTLYVAYVTLCPLCHSTLGQNPRDDILNDIEYSLYSCDLSNPFGRDKHTIKIVVRGTI